MKHLNCVLITFLCIVSSLVCPGGGLAYLNSRRASVCYVVLFLSTLLAAIIFRVIYSVELIFFVLLSCLLIYVVGLVHTIWQLIVVTPFLPLSFLCFPFNFLRSLGFFLLVALAFSFKSTILGFELYVIRSQSMLPNLSPGDIVLADTWFNRKGIEKNDVVFFLNTNRQDMVFVKRIQALPGDTVKHTALEFDLLTSNDLEKKSDHLYAEFETIEKGKVFVVGDNLPFSKDSRHFGSLDMGSIQAKGIWRLRKRVFFRL